MTWPPVFDGIGAMFVRTDNDPDVQLAKIPGVTWVAVKVNGDDASPAPERSAWLNRVSESHPHVAQGSWVYCNGPPSMDVAYGAAGAFRIYDVESAYKTDEAGPQVATWPAELVAEHHNVYGDCPAAVTSYGAYKTSINFQAFANAGWPVFAQLYGSFKIGDELSYYQAHGGPYPNFVGEGVKQLTRSLTLKPRQAVYRPESIDP